MRFLKSAPLSPKKDDLSEGVLNLTIEEDCAFYNEHPFVV